MARMCTPSPRLLRIRVARTEKSERRLRAPSPVPTDVQLGTLTPVGWT